MEGPDLAGAGPAPSVPAVRYHDDEDSWGLVNSPDFWVLEL